MPQPIEGEVEDYPGILPMDGKMPEHSGVFASRQIKTNKGPSARFQVRTDDRSNEINFQVEQLEECLGHPLDSLVADLVKIAVAVYAWDRFVRRTSDWSRTMKLTIPVQNKSSWDQYAKPLTSLLSLLTEDMYSITFTKAEGEASKAKFTTTNERPICLFSGGLDSFVGAATNIDSNPLLVSHYSSHRIQSIQRQLAGFLSAANPGIERYAVEVNLKGQNSVREGSQLSRSFLFLSVAAAFAVETGSNNLVMFENGPIAVNVPISESRMNTKTAHPKVLDLFSKLVSDVFGVGMMVSNPFQLLTKGEIIHKLDGNPFANKLTDTVTCWRYPRGLISLARSLQRSLEGNHCGICYPCIMRRISMNAAGLFDHDDAYLIDIFREYPFAEYPKLRAETIPTMFDLVRFASNLRELDDITLVNEYPDMSLNIGPLTSEVIIGMYRRYASEVIECFEQQASSHLAADLKKLL